MILHALHLSSVVVHAFGVYELASVFILEKIHPIINLVTYNICVFKLIDGPQFHQYPLGPHIDSSSEQLPNADLALGISFGSFICIIGRIEYKMGVIAKLFMKCSRYVP